MYFKYEAIYYFTHQYMCKGVNSPSQYFEDYRDGERSKKATDSKYGHRDGPEEGGCLCCKRLPISLNPCGIVESFNELQYKDTYLNS